MYRSRLRGKLDKDVLEYLSSIEDDLELLRYDIAGSEAHSIMLHEKKILKRDELKKILKALEAARKENLRKLASGQYEDIHEAIEAYVVKKAGAGAGGKMHTARSRNDQVALDIRMKARDDINGVSADLLALIDSLLSKAEKNRNAAMVMYTHLQHAQVGTFSHYLLSYADALLRDLDRLGSCYDRVNRSPLGAAAIGGTSLPIDRQRTATLLGFDGLVENSIDATTSRDFMTEFCFDLAAIMLDLSRMAEEFVLWSSSEFGYIELPDELTSSSSIMPQKKNPCPLELMRARASMVVGLLVGLMATVKSLPSGYSRDLQETKRMLWQAVQITGDSLRIMRAVVDGLRVNKNAMSGAARKSYALSLDIAEELVRKNVPFRLAHGIVGSLVRKAHERKKSLKDLDKKALAAAAGRDFPALELARIIARIDVERSLSARRSRGSPNPREAERMIRDRHSKTGARRKELEKRIRNVGDAFARLEKAVDAILR